MAERLFTREEALAKEGKKVRVKVAFGGTSEGDTGAITKIHEALDKKLKPIKTETGENGYIVIFTHDVIPWWDLAMEKDEYEKCLEEI